MGAGKIYIGDGTWVELDENGEFRLSVTDSDRALLILTPEAIQNLLSYATQVGIREKEKT